MSVTPINSRREPLGTFHAVSCRDASSLARDGEPYYDLNVLDTADGRPLAEILLADGVWLLADPDRDIVPGSEVDNKPGPERVDET